MSKRYRVVAAFFAALMAASVVLSGCGQAKDESKAKEQPQQPKKALIIGTGSVTGVYYPVGGAIASIITEVVPNVVATAEATGGSVANLRMVTNGDAQLALSGPNTAYRMFHGLPPYEKEPAKKVRAICALYPEVYQLVVLKDSGIKTFRDLVGKRVAVGAPGSGTEATGKAILELHGITYDQIKPQFLSFSEAVTALKDRNVDAAVIFAGVPTSAVIDLASVLDINIVSLDQSVLSDEAKMNQFLKDYPYLTRVTIPPGAYKGLDRSVDTLASPANLVTSSDMEADLIYAITKAIFDNVDKIAQAHVQGKNVKLENALKGVPIPLHPGAEKYFREAGLIK